MDTGYQLDNTNLTMTKTTGLPSFLLSKLEE